MFSTRWSSGAHVQVPCWGPRESPSGPQVYVGTDVFQIISRIKHNDKYWRGHADKSGSFEEDEPGGLPKVGAPGSAFGV